MSQETVFEILRNIAMADSMSYWVVFALTGLVFVIMRAMLPVKSLSFVLAPAVFWGGLTGIYALATWGIHFTNLKSADVVLSAAVGMVTALVLMIALLRLLQAVFRIRTPLQRSAHAPMIEPRRVRI